MVKYCTLMYMCKRSVHAWPYFRHTYPLNHPMCIFASNSCYFFILPDSSWKCWESSLQTKCIWRYCDQYCCSGTLNNCKRNLTNLSKMKVHSIRKLVILSWSSLEKQHYKSGCFFQKHYTKFPDAWMFVVLHTQLFS